MFLHFKEFLTYRLVLAGIAGCLAAWIQMPTGFFPGPTDAAEYFLPGTVFGLLVLLPLMENPLRYWLRSTILLCAATIAHFAMWITGFLLFDVLEALQWHEDTFISNASAVVLIGGPSGLVFGTIVALAGTRTLAIRFDWYIWITIGLASVFGGTFFAGIILGELGVLSDALSKLPIGDSNVYLAYVVLYLVFASVFALGQRQSLENPTRADLVLLGGLVLLLPLSVAWMTAM